jgi:branched-chain amino acid transport system permease protein
MKEEAPQAAAAAVRLRLGGLVRGAVQRHYYLWSLLMVAAALPLVGVLSPYQLNVAYNVVFAASLGYGLNFFSGFTGLPNLGYAALVGTGSYAFAYVIGQHGLPWPLGFATAVGAASALALLIGLPLLRITGIHFAVATVGVTLALATLAGTEYLEPVTAGPRGAFVRTPLSLQQQWCLAVGLLAVCLALTGLLRQSRLGLQLLAIRADETAASALGIPVGGLKLLAFVVSAAFAGVLGALRAVHLSYLEPIIAYDLVISLQALVVALLGGMGTVMGPLAGAIIVTTVAELVWSRLLTYHLLVYGGVLVAVTLLMPQGIITWLRRVRLLPRDLPL